MDDLMWRGVVRAGKNGSRHVQEKILADVSEDDAGGHSRVGWECGLQLIIKRTLPAQPSVKAL
jgi:hypothetical protein